MAAKTSIEWTRNDDGTAGKTWNPVRGCSIVSPGCHHCYAMKQAHRFSGVTIDKSTSSPHQHGNDRAPKVKSAPYAGLTKMTKAGPQWTGVVRTVESALLEPLSWRKPQRVFVDSMSDLFHEDVPDEFIDRVFAVMALAQRHTFQILTKRPQRMRDYLLIITGDESQCRMMDLADAAVEVGDSPCAAGVFEGREWPLSNVWLGTSVEDQPRADDRIPQLLQTPAAVRFISAEPLLGQVDLRAYLPPAAPALDWVIVGGES